MLKLTAIEYEIDNKKIIKEVSATIYPKEFIVIIGQNGAGKSTLLELFAGTKIPTQGTIQLDNKDISNLDLSTKAQLISRLYQQPERGSVGSMSVRENCALALYKTKMIRLSDGLISLTQSDICNRVINLFSEDILDKPMSCLSGGQRQLIASIMATAQETTRLLLLDEPTAALDFHATEKMLSQIAQVIQKKEIVTIMVTHDFDIARSLGTRLWVINQGKLLHDITDGHHTKLTLNELKSLMIT